MTTSQQTLSFLQDAYFPFFQQRYLSDPENQSVVFLRDREVTLKSDGWRVAINLNMDPYVEALATIGEDLLIVEKQDRI
jgi:hypothetical protein